MSKPSNFIIFDGTDLIEGGTELEDASVAPGTARRDDHVAVLTSRAVQRRHQVTRVLALGVDRMVALQGGGQVAHALLDTLERRRRGLAHARLRGHVIGLLLAVALAVAVVIGVRLLLFVVVVIPACRPAQLVLDASEHASGGALWWSERACLKLLGFFFLFLKVFSSNGWHSRSFCEIKFVFVKISFAKR